MNYTHTRKTNQFTAFRGKSNGPNRGGGRYNPYFPANRHQRKEFNANSKTQKEPSAGSDNYKKPLNMKKGLIKESINLQGVYTANGFQQQGLQPVEEEPEKFFGSLVDSVDQK